MFESTRRSRIVLAVLIITGVVLAISAHFLTRFPGDLEATLLIQSVGNQSLLALIKGISYVTGDWRAVILILVSGAVFWRYFGKLEGLIVLVSGLVTAVNEVFKIVINRPRPPSDMVNIFVNETSKSFPSGHAFMSVVVFGLMAYLITTHQTGRGQKILTTSLFIVLILWIGISRIYLGVHWTSDVIGGYVVGTPFLMLEILLYRRLKQRYGGKMVLTPGIDTPSPKD